ncbi:MAG: RNA polymerase sigma factor [Acidimicrobiia bacterium]
MSRSVETTIRQEGGQVLATLIRLTGDFTLAEDALQEATIVALEQWNRDGVPDKPAAWLTSVSRNKALDHIRREAKRTDKEVAATRLLASSDEGPEPTDPLRLIFTCCHPTLSEDAQVALTLRTVSQLTTREIARALLQPDATVGQRISRAKTKIKTAHIPYRVPSDAELPNRLPVVLHVLYLMFTAGYSAYEGPAMYRVELADEAIRITRMLADLMPDEPEVRGLLALMLATWARRTTRVDEHGDIVLLADQNRAGWDQTIIGEARTVLGKPTSAEDSWYRLQAAIALEHAEAVSFAATDWVRITRIYEALEIVNPSPVVRVNRAVAVAHARGWSQGLALLDEVNDQPEIQSWHLYWSTRAEMLSRLDRSAEALECVDRALACPMNDGDRRLLEGRRSALVALQR